MTDKPKLRTTMQQFESLHRDLDTARSTTRHIKVDRDALAALLADHSAMVRALGIVDVDTRARPEPRQIARAAPTVATNDAPAFSLEPTE